MLGKFSYSVPAAGSVNIPGLAVGAITANSLAPSYFSNEVDSVISNTFWTTLATKYLLGPDQNHFSLQTLKSYRDVEVTGWARKGRVFLRLDATGNAIYFDHNGETANGVLEIGTATGVGETTYGGTTNILYTNASLKTTVSGYVNGATDTTGHYLTFGVSGFDIYVKYNGVEFVRFKDYRQMGPGTVALKAITGYGWRGDNTGNITVTPLATKHFYSTRYAYNEFDLRDFGLCGFQTTANITAASNQLTVTSNPGFQVGDQIIVEVGGEAGAGARGTFGVGGVFPTIHYPDLATMNADTTKPDNCHAYVDGDTKVYQSWGGVWVYETDLWYTNTIAPRSLNATITAINGLTLTLDTAATTTTTNANVYYDNLSRFNAQVAAFGDNTTVVIPAGNFAFSDISSGALASKNNWTFTGAGKDNTKLFSPKGAASFDIRFYQCTNITVQNMTLQGNFRFNGYGFHLPDATSPPSFPSNLDFSSCTGCIGQNLRSVDGALQSLVGNFSHDTWFYDCEIILNDGHQRYTQWMLQFANCTGGGAKRVTITSPILTEACNTFESTNTWFENIATTNGLFAANSSSGYTFKACSANILANSKFSDLSLSGNDPILNINSNQDPSGSSTGPGTVIDPVFIQHGFVDSSNNLLVFISIDPHSAGVQITGSSTACSGSALLQCPDYVSAPQTFGGVGVRSDAPNVSVSNVRFVGKANYSFLSNIVAEGSVGSITVTNCVMDHAAVTNAGGVITSETGTLTNAQC